MVLTLNEKNRGIKIAWFFMIITIGGFLDELRTASQVANDNNLGFEGSYELGYVVGGKLAVILFLAIGMLLYNRTKKRKFKQPVRGSKFIDYLLAFILVINFINLLVTGMFAYGDGNDVMAFFYISSSLLAYAYALLAKPKSNHIEAEVKSK